MEKDENYPQIFLSSLNNLRQSKNVCDFTVKVGNESFSVHRAVLAAASNYFTAMFSSDMKEIREEFVDIKELDVEGVRQCIEYMYIGGIIPDDKTVQHTLKASHLIQLDGLTSICFRFLRKNISVETCLVTGQLSSLYDRHDVHELAVKFIVENFEAVTLTEMFPLITKSDLLHYIEASIATYEVTWQALVQWFSVAREETSELLLDVMKSTKVSEFPFMFLLNTVLAESVVKQNKSCQSLVITSLFHDIETLKRNLTTENFFAVKNLAMEYVIPNAEKSREALDEYLGNNFEQLSKMEGFCSLEEKEILDLFRSSKTIYSSEKVKWYSALNWVKHDEDCRKRVFPKLFKMMKIDLFSRGFLRKTVMTQTLVAQSPKCKDLLLKVLVAEKDEDRKAFVSHIACMRFRKGDIKALNLTNNQWKDLPSLCLAPNKQYVRTRKIVNVDDKVFCLDEKNLHQFDEIQTRWIQKQSLETQPSLSAQILSFQKQVYAIDRDFMASYSVIEDVWRENIAGCALDGFFSAASSVKFVYATGGKKNKKAIANATRFHPECNTWSEISPMNTSRNFASSAVLHEMIFVVGGMSGGINLDSVEIYVPVTKIWTHVKSMCNARAFPSACVVDNRLYVVGKGINEEGELLDTNSVEVYNEHRDEWEIISKCTWIGEHTPCCAIKLPDEDIEK